MRILFLNTKNGTATKEGISNYIESMKNSVDIFCFQEMYEEMESLCHKLLPKFISVRSDKYINIDEGLRFSKGTFIKPPLDFKNQKNIMDGNPNIGHALYTKVSSPNGILHILNVHGVSTPAEKLDCKDRLEQSQIIIEFLRDFEGPKIIGGDFNLYPQTESIKMFESAGYRNLIKDFGITNTRNAVAWKDYPNNRHYFSDYVFVTPDVKVINFQVPYNEVSDHLPMILDIELSSSV